MNIAANPVVEADQTVYLKDYQSYSTLVARAIKPPGFPGVGGTFTSRTQWFA